MNDLRIGSVCSGYRGLDAAVEAVFGGTTAWVSDIDPGANKILAHHWPDVPNHGDLTTTDWAAVEPVDIYCGGYPCQPFSLAGELKGTADDRHIWPYIAHSLRVLRPRIAIFENVANHLRLGFDTVLCDLADLGLDVQWCVAGASEVGAPHQRRRLIILATAQNADRQSGNQRRLAAPGQAESGRARADAGGRGGTPSTHANSLVPGNNGELPAGRDALRQRIRDDAPRCGTAPAANTGHGDESKRAWPTRGEEGQRPPVGSVAGRDRGIHQWGHYAPAVARWEAVTGRRAPWATDDRNRLSPEFVEWLMGLPAGHVTKVPDLTRTQQLHALGNGVVPQQAEAAIRLLADRAGVA